MFIGTGKAWPDSQALGLKTEKAHEDVIDVEIEMSPKAARIEPSLTPLLARRLALASVCRSLADADVPHFAISPLDDLASAVGVPEGYRAEALQALFNLLQREPGYISSILPAPRRPSSPRPGDRLANWEAIRKSRVIAVTWYRCDPTGRVVLGARERCEIEFWAQTDGDLVAPRANRAATRVKADALRVSVHPDDSTRLASRAAARTPSISTLQDFTHTQIDEITFPIDAVYTWVDGADPHWAARRAAAMGETYHVESNSAARFLSRDELRYSLRSLYAYAPWIRNVYIVTDDQRPSWLLEDSRLRLVSHREIFADARALPSFNSHAIESQLHHIDGLSEHFLYFNDDMFFGRAFSPHLFFLANGATKFFPSGTRVPFGPVLESDTPVDAALKNNRRLMEETFGRTITQTFKHTPYALRRSIVQELEDRFPEEFEKTMRSQFRSAGDISVPSSLHHHYAFATGRAVPGPIRYCYTQLAVPDLSERLDRILATRAHETFCLNDAYSVDSEVDGQLRALAPFLEGYFPVPSPWEVVSELADGTL